MEKDMCYNCHFVIRDSCIWFVYDKCKLDLICPSNNNDCNCFKHHLESTKIIYLLQGTQIYLCESCHLRLREYGVLWTVNTRAMFLENSELRRVFLTGRRADVMRMEMVSVPYEARIEMLKKELIIPEPPRLGRPPKVMCHA